MSVGTQLKERSQGVCELCNTSEASTAYTLSPKSGDTLEEQAALCQDCLRNIDTKDNGAYWRFLEGSIWNPEPVIQALSYRILQQYKEEDWAAGILSSVDLDEQTVAWAMSAFDVAEVHRDTYGNVLANGDTVVLTQALDVKGTSFSAAKGTVVKKIKLVHDNIEQIEGKINDQTIVILTKYVKKG